jgi:hypothetical protein
LRSRRSVTAAESQAAPTPATTIGWNCRVNANRVRKTPNQSRSTGRERRLSGSVSTLARQQAIASASV